MTVLGVSGGNPLPCPCSCASGLVFPRGMGILRAFPVCLWGLGSGDGGGKISGMEGCAASILRCLGAFRPLVWLSALFWLDPCPLCTQPIRGRMHQPAGMPCGVGG